MLDNKYNFECRFWVCKNSVSPQCPQWVNQSKPICHVIVRVNESLRYLHHSQMLLKLNCYRYCCCQSIVAVGCCCQAVKLVLGIISTNMAPFVLSVVAIHFKFMVITLCYLISCWSSWCVAAESKWFLVVGVMLYRTGFPILYEPWSKSYYEQFIYHVAGCKVHLFRRWCFAWLKIAGATSSLCGGECRGKSPTKNTLFILQNMSYYYLYFKHTQNILIVKLISYKRRVF